MRPFRGAPGRGRGALGQATHPERASRPSTPSRSALPSRTR
nr:MAG TPA: hypothetical protein [Caudoviricetes sp.]